MYAVVQSGGKQYRVSHGQTLQVERSGSPGDEISLHPVLFTDGSSVLVHPAELESVKVTAVVVSENRGPKIRGFTYKSKSNQRRRWGHRQTLSTIKVTSIEAGVGSEADVGSDG